MTALLVIDIQNDFCENGALEVPNANDIIPYVNQLITDDKYDKIIFSQDFHPKNHISFAENHPNKKIGEFITLENRTKQILWPTHCVQKTFGSEFHPNLLKPLSYKIITKGTNRKVDSYSAFYDNNHEITTGLSDYLLDEKITDVEIVGLALDYCVKFSALDAMSEGFKTSIHFKGTKAVNINPDDGDKTLLELIKAGITIIS